MARPMADEEASGEGLQSAERSCAQRQSQTARQYAPFLPDPGAEGLVYRPLVWSCYGREHPDTSAVLERLARRAARRGAPGSWRLVLRRLRAGVGAALARRAAAMLRAGWAEAVAIKGHAAVGWQLFLAPQGDARILIADRPAHLRP